MNPPATNAVTKGAPKTCRCGHDKDHPMVVREAEYTLWGWIMLSMLGMTPKPKRIAFICTLCRTPLAYSQDPRDLLGPKAVARTAEPSTPES
jgi:hypothetical protein